MKSFRLSDLSLVVKMAVAPAVAVLMLALATGASTINQHQQTAAIDRIVRQDMAVSLDLARVSKRITGVHGELYLLMTNQAANSDVASIPTRLQALLGETDAIKTDLAKLRGRLPADQRKPIDALLKDLADYRGGIEVVGSMMGMDFATAASFVTPFEAQYARMTTTLDAATKAVQTDASKRASQAAGQAAMAGNISLGLALLTLLAVAGISAAVIMGINRAINGIAGATGKLAAGDHSQDLTSLARRDELGAIVASLNIFKENQQRLETLRTEQSQLQEREEAGRRAVEIERAETQAAQNAVVSALAEGLSQLSSGDLTHRIHQPFPAEYDSLRKDLNTAMERLQSAMQVISRNAAQITTGADEIAGAADDLSRRTEQQAASLEETAAALDQITATVKKSAAGAAQARQVVQNAKSGAAEGGDIVRRAVEAMGAIEESAGQISQIIGVIDEIAFQTNLLALNAGVEAARAGDSGRGFAVVAQEVRALAQRSADAAKEIKGLITASTAQVDSGVQLVARTGKALEAIVDQVAEIDAVVSEIAAAAGEQATGLNEVNSAITRMDQVTQQNAAMVEESTAATHALKREVVDLSDRIGQFRTGHEQEAKAAARPQPARPVVAAPRPAPRARPSYSGGAATARKADEWDEF